ncbi:MAG: TetR/AcrR family transcriptional regulator [Pseudomonadota bacterium]
MTNRLTKEDWIIAGFQALSELGPGALKAELLARRIKSTKGSFYWHFKDVPAFHAAMLEHWKEKAVSDIIDTLAEIPDPAARFRRLASMASEAAPERYGGFAVEPAIRAWSMYEPRVAQGVAEVDRARIAYLAELLGACDRPRGLALMVYGAYVGLDDLASRGEAGTVEALSDLVERILA